MRGHGFAEGLGLLAYFGMFRFCTVGVIWIWGGGGIIPRICRRTINGIR